MLVHWPVNTMRVNQLLDQDKTVDDDTIQQLWRGWLWNSTPNTDTRLAGGGWNANHAVGALLARALYVCECNSEDRDAPNDVGGSTGEPAPEARGEGANDSEGSTGPSAPEARGENAPGEAAMPEEGAAEADLADELDTLWTAFPLITELHVSPSEFHYMTLREIRDATEVLQLYWADKILSSAENREAAEHSLIAIMTRIGYLLSVAAPPAVMDDVEGRAVMPAGDNETLIDHSDALYIVTRKHSRYLLSILLCLFRSLELRKMCHTVDVFQAEPDSVEPEEMESMDEDDRGPPAQGEMNSAADLLRWVDTVAPMPLDREGARGDALLEQAADQADDPLEFDMKVTETHCRRAADIIKDHHVESGMDCWIELSMTADLNPGNRLVYSHDYRGLYNDVSQVMYYHNPTYQKRGQPRSDLDQIRFTPLNSLPCILEIFPTVSYKFDDCDGPLPWLADEWADLDDAARSTKWQWLVSCKEIFLVDPVNRKVLRAPPGTSLGIIPLVVYYARGCVGIKRAGLAQSGEEMAADTIANDDDIDADMNDPVRLRQLESMTEHAHIVLLK